MISEYELHSDERYQDSRHLLLGGVVCTKKRATILQSALNKVRHDFELTGEMRWGKVSKQYLDAYKAWVDVFFDDPHARFSVLKVDISAPDWKSFNLQSGKRPTRDAKLSSVFYQFLLVSFGPLRDTKRWWIYPDASFFSRDKVLNRVEFLFNRTYKKAFGPKTSRIIRMARSQDSKKQDLTQLADILLGAIGCSVTGYLPQSTARRALVGHCQNRDGAMRVTSRQLEKISVNDWTSPTEYRHRWEKKQL